MDWEKIAHLLRIAEKAHQWPQLHALRNAALAELQKHVEEATPTATEPSSPPAPEPEKDDSDAIGKGGDEPPRDPIRRRLSDDQSGD